MPNFQPGRGMDEWRDGFEQFFKQGSGKPLRGPMSDFRIIYLPQHQNITQGSEKKTVLRERLKCSNTNTIKSIIEGRIRVEKYLEKKDGDKVIIRVHCVHKKTILGSLKNYIR